MIEPDILYIKSYTFRRHLQVFIGWDKEYYDKEWLGIISECIGVLWWCAYHSDEHDCNVIWLRDYEIETLCHELVHICQFIAKQCMLEYDWEPMAYLYEELLTNILLQSKKKFKLAKRNKDFYLDKDL